MLNSKELIPKLRPNLRKGLVNTHQGLYLPKEGAHPGVRELRGLNLLNSKELFPELRLDLRRGLVDTKQGLLPSSRGSSSLSVVNYEDKLGLSLGRGRHGSIVRKKIKH